MWGGEFAFLTGFQGLLLLLQGALFENALRQVGKDVLLSLLGEMKFLLEEKALARFKLHMCCQGCNDLLH